MDKPDIRLGIGKTGSGKTCHALKLIEEHRRLVLFDTTGHDYRDGVTFYDLAKLKDFWAGENSQGMKRYRGAFRLIYRPFDPRSEFEEVCKLAFLCGNLTLVAEELPSLCDSNSIGREFRKVVMRGRHRDITFIGLMQRPKGVHRDVTSQASEIFIFTIDEPGDVKYFSDRIPGKEIEEKIKQLEPYQYIHWQQHQPELLIGKDQL